jgi:hypothetical protein
MNKDKAPDDTKTKSETTDKADEFTKQAANLSELAEDEKSVVAVKRLETRTARQLLIPDFSPKSVTLDQVIRHPDNRIVMAKFFFITFLMFTVPFIVFYYVNGMEDLIPDKDTRITYSAIASVISVQFVIGFYVCLACFEQDHTPATIPKKKKE